MKKILIPVLLLLLLVGCTNYQKEVAKDCPSNTQGSICIDDVPLHITQYANTLVLDTLALFSKMRFIIEADEVDWVYRMEEGKLKIHSRYMTPIVKNETVPFIWFCFALLCVALLILGGWRIDRTMEQKRELQTAKVYAAEKEKEAAKEMQAVGISIGSRESDLIAKQAMLIDNLTEEVDKIIEYKEWEKEQRAFNTEIYNLAVQVDKDDGRSSATIQLIGKILDHNRKV
jgi:hypothetical protein